MTDNYDLDPHEHEAHEGEAHQSQGEAWPDDQPPVDDFTDPGAEETATSSEETGAHQEEEMMDSEPRKSSALLPIIAGIGGLLFLGAILYWQFGRSSSEPPSLPSPPPLQIAQAPVVKPAAVPIVASDTKPTSKDQAVDLAAIMKQSAAPAPADVAPKTSFAATGNPTVALPMPSPPPAAAPSSVAPPSAAPAPAILPPPSTSVNMSIETRVNELSTQMDELKRELDKTTQQLSQVGASLSSSSLGNTSVENRLAKIEEQMKHIENPSKTSTVSPVLFDSTSPLESVSESKPLTTKKHKTKAIKMAHKASSRGVKSVHIHWVLRAATPTEAWVAKNESTPELHHIRVGDELSGIGHINAIRQNGDSWVIEGSTGTIN